VQNRQSAGKLAKNRQKLATFIVISIAKQAGFMYNSVCIGYTDESLH
jgi:hypothetical protein